MDDNFINKEKKISNILYLFNEGRSERIKHKDGPKDFFYFYHDLDESIFDKSFIELKDLRSQNLFFKLLKFFEKLIIKFIKLPTYAHKIISTENLKKIKRSDLVILTNETLGYSMIFILYYFKRSRPNLKTILFVMGLFQQSNQQSKVRRIFLNFMLRTYDKFIFLGKEEYDYAVNKYVKYENKFFYLQFAIDQKYWIKNSNNLSSNQILFVGNDLNRDYSFLKKLTQKLGQYNFVIVSNKFSGDEFNENVTLINSNWRSAVLSDVELKEIYNNSLISIIPTKNTLQPSGQSVGLQSISMKIPLIISKSEGFWGKEVFIDKEDILLLENNIEEWEKNIDLLVSNSEKRQSLVDSAYKKLIENYKYDDLFIKFIDILSR